MQPHPIPSTPSPGALLGSQPTVGSDSCGDPLENEHKTLQESPSLSLELLSSSPNPKSGMGEASHPALLG